MVLHGASDSETRQHTHPAARRNPLAALASDDQKRMPMATTHALRPTGTVPICPSAMTRKLMTSPSHRSAGSFSFTDTPNDSSLDTCRAGVCNHVFLCAPATVSVCLPACLPACLSVCLSVCVFQDRGVPPNSMVRWETFVDLMGLAII